MAHIEIRIQTIEERQKQNEPLFDKISDDSIHCQVDGFAILEGGMRSGKTSCAFVSREHGGVIMEISAEMLHTCLAGLNGAEMRFMNEKTKNN